MLPTLKYRRLRGDMIEVLKPVYGYYDVDAMIELKLNANLTIRGKNLNCRNSHLTIHCLLYTSDAADE